MRCNALNTLLEIVERCVLNEGLRPFVKRCNNVRLGQVRSVIAGRAPRATTIQALCDALGLEFYVGHPRQITSNMLPVFDHQLAVAMAALADEYEELNNRGRETLLIRFWSFHPELLDRRKRCLGRLLAQLEKGNADKDIG